MTIKEQLVHDLQDAMRSGDTLRKDTIRMARAAIQRAEADRRSELFDRLLKTAGVRARKDESPDIQISDEQKAEIDRQSQLDDAAVQAVLMKEIKQRQESAEAYEHNNRPELASKERAEAAVLQAYLPQQMSDEAIENEVRGIIAEVGASGPRDMNKVMPVAMQRMKGRADGRAVNRVVTQLLTEGAPR